MGPITLFDKSFLQMLNPDEAVWFDHFFLTNVCPSFYIETLADLEKEDIRPGRTFEEEVRFVADKFPEFHGSPSMGYLRMCRANLLGFEVPMTGQVILPGGRPVKYGDKKGVVFERSDESEAFERWQDMQFRDVERSFAKAWRRQMLNLDLSTLPEKLTEFGIDVDKCKNMADAAAIASAVVSKSDNFPAIVRLLSGLTSMSYEESSSVIRSWSRKGGLSINEYAPYAAFVARVEIFFYISLRKSFISVDRPSNRMDISYLYYLPFCMIFVSSDRIHRSCAKFFLRKDQRFIWGIDLKNALAQIDEFFASSPVSEIEKGLASLCPFPPDGPGPLVAELWDQFFSPAYRKKMKERFGRKEEASADPEFMKSMREMANAPKIPAREIDFDVSKPDSIMIKRKIRLKRGRWYQLSKDTHSPHGS